MPIYLTQTMPQSQEDRDAWDSYGLDSVADGVIDGASDRNVRPDGFDITAGDSFATVEGYLAPDGKTYHVLLTTDWCNYWAPWTTIHATLYDTSDPDDMTEYAADVAKWEAMPEEDPDAEWGDDDEPRYEVVVGNIGTVYDGPDENEAESHFADYVAHSTGTPSHRCYGEDVTLIESHDIAKEHRGHLQADEEAGATDEEATDEESDWDFACRINGEHDNLDGVFLAMIDANKAGNRPLAIRLASIYHGWLSRGGWTMDGYSDIEAMAVVRAILA